MTTPPLVASSPPEQLKHFLLQAQLRAQAMYETSLDQVGVGNLAPAAVVTEDELATATFGNEEGEARLRATSLLVGGSPGASPGSDLPVSWGVASPSPASSSASPMRPRPSSGDQAASRLLAAAEQEEEEATHSLGSRNRRGGPPQAAWAASDPLQRAGYLEDSEASTNATTQAAASAAEGGHRQLSASTSRRGGVSGGRPASRPERQLSPGLSLSPSPRVVSRRGAHSTAPPPAAAIPAWGADTAAPTTSSSAAPLHAPQERGQPRSPPPVLGRGGPVGRSSATTLGGAGTPRGFSSSASRLTYEGRRSASSGRIARSVGELVERDAQSRIDMLVAKASLGQRVCLKSLSGSISLPTHGAGPPAIRHAADMRQARSPRATIGNSQRDTVEFLVQDAGAKPTLSSASGLRPAVSSGYRRAVASGGALTPRF